MVWRGGCVVGGVGWYVGGGGELGGGLGVGGVGGWGGWWKVRRE